MHRGSDKHSARQDDALADDVEGMVRGNGPTRAEEWKDPEPPADDDNEADLTQLGADEEVPEGTGEDRP